MTSFTHDDQGQIQEIGKEGAEHRQARVARGVRGHAPLEHCEIWTFQKKPFPAFLGIKQE